MKGEEWEILGREFRRQRGLRRADRDLNAVERLLASPKVSPATRKQLRGEARRLKRRRARLGGALLPKSDLLIRLAGLRDEGFGGRVETSMPILLLPLRLETRFRRTKSPTRPYELRIRFIPDVVAIRTHERSLTPDEREQGAAFWTLVAAAEDDDTKVSAWGALAAAVGAERAPWVALSTHPTVPPREAPPWRDEAWGEPPTVEVMPEYLHVRGYAGGHVVFSQTTKNPIDPSLLVGPDPAPAPPGVTGSASPARSPTEFVAALPPEIRWLADFSEAEDRGLGLAIPLTEAEATAGFDRILVAGVRASAGPDEGEDILQGLLEGHRYADGFSLVPPGTPTNNTEEEGAGFTSTPHAAETYRIEFGPTRWEVGDPKEPRPEERDGQILARALGLSPTVLERVAFAEGGDQFAALHMARALWPATWGYYLRQILADTVPDHVTAEIREHFVRYVRGRGPFPAIRVEQTPYGILPVTSLRAWLDAGPRPGIQSWLPDLLWRLGQDWLAMSDQAPRVVGAADPERSLFDVMTMLPTSGGFYATPVFGEEFIAYLAAFLAAALGFAEAPAVQSAEEAVDRALERLGFAGALPRLRSLSFGEPAEIPQPYLVAPVADSEPFPQSEAENYLLWVAEATPEQFESEEGLPAIAPQTLLYRVLRHARRNAFVEGARYILHEFRDPAARSLRFEPEISSLPGVGPGAGAQLGSPLEQPLPLRHRGPEHRGWTTGAYLYGIARRDPQVNAPVRIGRRTLRPDHPLLNELTELTESLRVLARLPKDRLQLLLTETLDLCSHRLDAWITSLATRRLEQLRAPPNGHPRGIYLGAYGWVENLRLQRARPHEGGFLLAPTLDHANAAAVLRNGFLTHRSSVEGEQLSVDLSSERVSTALSLFDGLHAGHPLGALLGYRFERAIHERRGIRLEPYVPALRDAFPLEARRLTPHEGAVEEVAANNVVDGRALREAWTTFRPRQEGPGATAGLRLFDRDDLPEVGSPEFGALAEELGRLDELFDAMADLSLAEAVFQSVRGDFDRARAVTDAMAGARHMPDLEFPRSRRGGPRIRHRVIAPLTGAPGAGPAGWPAPLTPRARAARPLNDWLKCWIGDPKMIGVYVRFLERSAAPEAAPVVMEEVVTLDQLDLQAIDVLEFTQSAAVAQDSELELRIHRLILQGGAGRSDVRIAFDDPPPWDRRPRPAARPARMFAEVAPMLDYLRRALSRGRPALPADLRPPEATGEGPLAGIDFTDLAARAKRGVLDLWNAYTRLETALAPFGAPGVAGPDATEWSKIRDACAALGEFGFTGALPPSVFPPTVSGADRPEARLLLQRELGLQNEVAARLADVLAASGPPTAEAVETRLYELNQQRQALDRPITEAAASLAPGELTEQQRKEEEMKKESQRAAFFGRCQALLKGVFGRTFPAIVKFKLSDSHPLAPSAAAKLHVGNEDALLAWFHQMGEIHPGVGDFLVATLLSEIQGTGAELRLRPAQVPYRAGDPWVGSIHDLGGIPPDILSLLFTDDIPIGAPTDFSGVVLGSWEETVPNATETGGLAFHFDQAGTQPPQALLLAVPPPTEEVRWHANHLFAILNEALDLVRVRTVDPDLLKTYGAVVPSIFLAHTSKPFVPMPFVGTVAPTIGIAPPTPTEGDTG